MIESLHIEDLGVIEEADLPLSRGLTALTGETGAGKTMVLTSLGLLLGQRAETTIVRTGAERSLVEGAFLVDPDSRAASRAVEAGADLDDLVTRFDATGCDDLAYRARVVHEVLAQHLRGANTERLGDGLYFEGAEQARLGGDGALGQGRVEAARIALVAGAGGSAHAGKSSARNGRGRGKRRCEARSVTGLATNSPSPTISHVV